MNKKLTQLVPVFFIVAFILFLLVAFLVMKSNVDKYADSSSEIGKTSTELKERQEKYSQLEVQQQQNLKKLQSIKPIYKSTNTAPGEDLSMFGNMFENIVNLAQSDGLLIRSIEYSMNPESDPLLSLKTNLYNVCELKFFFVATYPQLLKYLADVNEKFEYLAFISKMNVSAFSGNTDYLLINMSITLYSQKSDAEAQLTVKNDNAEANDNSEDNNSSKKSKSKNKNNKKDKE